MEEKSVQQKILEKILRFMARCLLARHKPTVIGITGSVGKTSARTAIFHVLDGQFHARQTDKNYNNEIGVPLTIIGAQTGGRSLFGWLRVFFVWVGACLAPSSRYPDVLIVEIGIDHPGDMTYLMSVVDVDIAVVTAVTNAHQEFFPDLAAIAKEKGILVASTKSTGVVVLNGDDRNVREMSKRAQAATFFFGKQRKENDLVVSDVAMIREHGDGQDHQACLFGGITFKINYEGKTVPVRLNHVVARHHVYAAAAAIGVATVMKMNLVDIAGRLSSYSSPPGRMNQLTGKNGSVVIDDTYNASPKASSAALETLQEYSAKRRIAVLGDMLELGEESEKEHRRIAQEIMKNDVDVFFAVGERMETAYHALREKDFPRDRLFYFENPMLTAQKISEMVRAGDVVLVKGSQGMRMEKIVEKIVADESKASELLCRQSPAWKRKDFVKPE